jgi:hypothetical protein
MLPYGVVSRWEPVWVDGSQLKNAAGQQLLNDSAELLLAPMPFSKLVEIGTKHGVCMHCGAGIVRDDHGAQALCPKCKGNGKTWFDQGVRQAIIKHCLRDWRHVLAMGPAGPVEAPFNPAALDVVAEMTEVVKAISSRCQELAGVVEAESAKA